MSDNVTREPYRNAWYKQLQDKVFPYLVPDSDSTLAGKVLSVDNEGNPSWSQPAEELPIITESDEGKVLMVDEGIPKWKDAPVELPTATSADEGKVLMVDSNGDYVLGTVSGGLPYINMQLQSEIEVV